MRTQDRPQRRPHHLARAASAACALLAACAGVGPTRVFAPVADHLRTVPRSLGERGFAPALTPPPSVGWDLAVVAVQSDSRGSRYELRCTFRDAARMADPAASWRIEPVFAGAEIVDDEGRRFPCVRARVPIDEDPRDAGEDEPSRSFTWVFEVSGSYDFGRVQSVAVHWGFALAGQPYQITSRFRVA